MPLRRIAALCMLAAVLSTSEALVASGQRIAFLGDSITAYGAETPLGYVNAVVRGLAANGIAVKAVPAGVGGNTSRNMLARLEDDVLAGKPDWMVLSCGVNDVWRSPGVPLEDFRRNIAAILDAAAAARVRVLLCTATPIGEGLATPRNAKLAAYNAALRTLAEERRLPLADLNAAFQAALAVPADRPGDRLTVDGVHMNPHGNLVMATGILRAFGLDEAGIGRAEAAWLDDPRGIPALEVPVGLSLRQYRRLEAAAAQAGLPLRDFVGGLLRERLEALTAAP